MKKEELHKYFAEKSPLIEKALKNVLPPRRKHINNLHDAIDYALCLDEPDISKRGKRIRPLLCLLTCEMLGGDIKKALPFAVAIELMHNYCLVHDDIEDGDTVRRGRPAVWAKFGLAHGINTGDYMLTTLYRFLLQQKGKLWSSALTLRLLELMAETLEHTLIGQALDINARSSHSTTMAHYLKMVREKTGYYLAAPILGGAIIAGAPEYVLSEIRKFGKYIGPLFQIMDDIIDLTAGKGRNEIGADIKEGKRSFMVVYVNERCSRREASEMFAILDKPRNKTTKKDIKRILEIFERYGAIKAAYAYCQRLKRLSQKVLKSMPIQLREALSTFSELLSERVR
ncbi:polyprenyl synthetase family protein [Candidatus Sumerlaeota bacterium]|nr:polyprenyl synthetase family protein [Candidatus Sumerlaeota bacterium]